MTTTNRPRKPMTPEEQTAWEARRAQMQAVTKQLAALSDEERAAMAQRIGVILTCEARALSPWNCCMLAFQRPDATVVGGFQQWKRVGRKVKKGERGSYIWIPLGTRETDGAGQPQTAMPDERRFKMVAVFDLSQTEAMEEEEGS
jgi:antirestriction factor ArdC-like protein